MDLLFESKRAGNNNVNVELTGIINKMFKDKLIDKKAHRMLSLKIKD